MNELTRKPAVRSSAIGLGATLVTAAALAPVATPALAFVGVGFVCLTLALVRMARGLATLGGLFVFLAVLVAGMAGAPAPPLLLGMCGAVLAWDATENAIGLGEQMGRDATTRRAELAHGLFTTTVVFLAAVVGYGLYRTVSGGRPLAALLALLLGVVFLAIFLRA